jgi:MFS superfamily sulfate permease-like transporter
MHKDRVAFRTFASAVDSLRKNWRQDLLAGFQVFLIALPLCLGISIASGFPAMSGLIAAIVGGIFVSRISGTFVTINGPAAGLIVVILDGVNRLGHGDALLGYKLTTAAIVCAGLIQIAFGFLKAGRLSAFFPVSAVHGMLAAIGLIIMAKQIHVALGVKPEVSGILGTIAAIPHSIQHLNPAVALIGLSSLLLLISYPRIPFKWVKIVPAPLWVIAWGIILSQWLGVAHSYSYQFMGHEYRLGPEYLLNLNGGLFDALALPNFSEALSLNFLLVVVSIALVSSIETLLSATAIDKIDPERRKSNLNRDLLAIGAGTAFSGFLGGLPMIAEIIRSSANVNSGARTQWSNFFHGSFILLFTLLAPSLLGLIPLATLSALLVFTGFRLASPKEFKRMKLVGWDQLGVFLITIVTTLASDLLIGIAVGIGAKIIFHCARKVPIRLLFKAKFHLIQKGPNFYHVHVSGPLIFSNYIALIHSLDLIPRDSILTLSIMDVTFLDHTVMEYIHQLQREFSLEGGRLDMRGHEHHRKYSSHPLAARKLRA